jgi:anti-anti-sigma regulatory factor
MSASGSARTDAPLDSATNEAVFHLVKAPKGLRLVDVQGELEDADVSSLSAMLNRALGEHAKGIAVDLRGCPDVGRICLSALLAASSTLRARGGGGVKLVTFPGTRLHHTVIELGELPDYRSASEALLSFGVTGSPR